MRTMLRVSLAVVMALAAAGCATTVNSQAVNSIYQTHKIVREMHGDLAPRVTELNRTSAELLARVDASETQARQLQAVVEENQVRFEAMQAKLDEIADVIYEYLRTSPGAGAYSSPRGSAGSPPTYVDVVPPSESSFSGPIDLPGGIGAPSALEATTVVGAAAGANAVADFNGALQSLNEEDYANALTKFDAFLKRYPNNDYTHRARLWKGRCLFRLERFDEAIAEFTTLRQSFPNSDKVPLSMYYQAMAHLQIGQRDEAVALLEDLVQKYPSDLVTPTAKAALRNLKEEG
jgi:tol-pal system protein YbgF